MIATGSEQPAGCLIHCHCSSSRLLRPQGAVASHRDYAARAVRTEEKAERALAPSLADSSRRSAKS